VDEARVGGGEARGGEGVGVAAEFGLCEAVDELGLHDERGHATGHVLVQVYQLLQVGAGPPHLGCVEVVLLKLLHDQQVDQLVLLEVALTLVSDLLNVAGEGHFYMLLQELLVGQRAARLLHQVHGPLWDADCPNLQGSNHLVVKVPALFLRTVYVAKGALTTLHRPCLP
jgi:hypothetical protein